MAARETKAQMNARVATLLAHYDAQNRAKNKLDAEVKALKEEIAAIPAGTYGEWMRSHGTPREIVDQSAVKQHYKEAGLSLPMKTTDAPIVVSHVVK